MLNSLKYDDNGLLLFSEVFDHTVSAIDGVSMDVIKTNGNIWLPATEVLFLMGYPPHTKGGFARTLSRISHPDIIKIKDTPFRHKDGRRNRGSLISPRAILQFDDTKTQGRNPIAANNFIEWMNKTIIPQGSNVAACSPAVKAHVTLEPVFHAVTRLENEDEKGRALDPMRPLRPYKGLAEGTPIGAAEIEFCICPKRWDGLGDCWCRRKGGLRRSKPATYDGDDLIDDDDDFTPIWPVQRQLQPTPSQFEPRYRVLENNVPSAHP